MYIYIYIYIPFYMYMYVYMYYICVNIYIYIIFFLHLRIDLVAWLSSTLDKNYIHYVTFLSRLKKKEGNNVAR